MMRCPLRVKAFDKPDECDPECAWLVAVFVGGELKAVCSMVLAGDDEPRAPLNTMEVDDGKKAGE